MLKRQLKKVYFKWSFEYRWWEMYHNGINWQGNTIKNWIDKRLNKWIIIRSTKIKIWKINQSHSVIETSFEFPENVLI